MRLLVTLINSPFGPHPAHAGRVVRYGLRGSAKDGAAKEAAAVADLSRATSPLTTDDIDRLFDTTANKSAFRSIR